MPVKYYTVGSRVGRIKGVSVNELTFEEEVYSSTGLKHKELIERILEKNEDKGVRSSFLTHSILIRVRSLNKIPACNTQEALWLFTLSNTVRA